MPRRGCRRRPRNGFAATSGVDSDSVLKRSPRPARPGAPAPSARHRRLAEPRADRRGRPRRGIRDGPSRQRVRRRPRRPRRRLPPRARPRTRSPPRPASTRSTARRRSLDDPNSIWVVVNKLRPMNPQDFEPARPRRRSPVEYTNEPELRQEASDARGRDVRRRARRGRPRARVEQRLPLVLRRRRTSTTATTSRPRAPGSASTRPASRWTSAPLSGECSLDVCFADTPEGVWLRDNACAVRVHPALPGRQDRHHRLHVRAVALPLRRHRRSPTEMHETGVTTLEEFFGLPPAPDYG